ncbi:hypothetical protein ACHAXR_006271 [Thalassiosira sp. AJA248-18]
MISVPASEPATTMTAAAPAFPSDASRATITTEHLALIGFAARLGTCVNNDDAADGQDAKSVRDEAMLLMSLLMGKKAEEILSEEIGVKESRSEKRKKSRPTECDMGNFSFTFPSLSLQPHAGPMGAAAETKTTGAAIEIGASEAQDEESDLPPPSELLGRTQSVRDKDGIRDSSEAMAHNVLESFGAALVWRAKTWIKSLANVLALKEQKRIDALKAATRELGGSSDGGATHEDEDEKGACASTQEASKEKDDLMNSKEMQIIDAIVKSSEEVSVVNVKTSYRVLPNKVSPKNSDALSIRDEEPSSKKARTESPQDVKDYKVTHKLMFEATVSMTSNDGVRYNGIKLQAPGYIQGTFSNKAGSTREGEETLTGVSMTLDTDVLALSLERQSRLVVRRAAEAAVMAASGIDCASSPHYMESPHVHHSIISPRYVLMSPVPAYPNGDLSTELPSVPSVNALNGQEEEEEPKKAPPALVSSAEDHSSDSSAATTLSLKPSIKNTPSPASSPSFPALLSVANEELSRGD